MDNPDYADLTVKKLKVFNENKIFLGKNLIITMESSATPLNSRQVENLINEYLKGDRINYKAESKSGK